MSAGAASGDSSRKELDADDALIGTVIDRRYKITGLIGRGGMGSVYRAEHVTMRKAFAVKLLSPRTTDPRERARFDREAFATGRATHPNCVMASDCGTLEDGTRYLAMELLEGDTLAERLDRDRRLTVEAALHVSKHILRGVGHAHGLGVVHRDLKPRNIMLVEHLDDADFAKVLDFGLAKLIGDAQQEEGRGDLTEAGITFGTPAYMSPEQASGMPIDARADLYAVGVLMFEMLTGRPPYCGDDPQATLMLHVQGTLPSIADVAPEVPIPAAVEALVRRALDKHRDERFQDATEFVAAIEACEKSLARDASAAASDTGASTEPMSPASAPPQASRSAVPTAPRRSLEPRQVKLAIGGAAVLLAVAVVAIVASLGGSDPEQAQDKQANQADQVATVERARVQDLDRAEALMRSGKKHRAAEVLTTLRKRHPKNALVPYIQGGLYMRWPWPVKAMQAYRSAVRLDPTYRTDAALLRNTIHTLLSPSAHKQAMQLLVEDLDVAARPALRRAASEHKSPLLRRRAAEALKRIDEIRP